MNHQRIAKLLRIGISKYNLPIEVIWQKIYAIYKSLAYVTMPWHLPDDEFAQAVINDFSNA